jgi:VWFA-related protein
MYHPKMRAAAFAPLSRTGPLPVNCFVFIAPRPEVSTIARPILIPFALLFLFASALQVAAQTPAGSAPAQTAGQFAGQAASPAPRITVTSRLVVVDVVVRDGKAPVTGLKADDFSILEDGQPQNAAFFESHFAPADDNATALASAAQVRVMPPDTFTNLPSAPHTDSVNVLLLDALNTTAEDALAMRKQMIRTVAKLPPGQRIAVFALGTRLRLLQGFTDDRSLLLAALNDKNAVTPASLLQPGEQKTQERTQTAWMAQGGVPPDVIDTVRNFMSDSDAAQTGMRVTITLEALQQIARYLSGIPGRKNLIWLSGSFPVEMYVTENDPAHHGQDVAARQFEDQLRSTADMLEAARVAVYPVDARGVLLQPVFNAAQQTDYRFNAAVLKGDLGNAHLQMETDHGSMDVLAQQTGGRPVYDSNDLGKAVADAVSDGSNFYTLAYQPTDTNFNGKFRKIEIRVKHGKYQLFYRAGYYADNGPPAGDRGDKGEHDVFRAALQRGVPAASQIVFDVRVAAPGKDLPSGKIAGSNEEMKDRANRYAIDFAVDLRRVEVTPSPKGTYEGSISAAALAYDRDGKPLNWIANTIPISLSTDAWKQARQSGLQIHQILDLPAGDVFLRCGVYDPASGRIGTLEIPIHVTEPPK